ncbi:MAG: SpvB/TcaC N-terminal domain-containing protein [Pseudomonadota bacterium]
MERQTAPGARTAHADAAKAPDDKPFAVSAPSLALPKGGGAIRGIGEKFAANPVTGGASFSIPIAASVGRAGFGPQLALAYDSGAGNGPFGFGWSLSLPEVRRKTDKGLPRYDDASESDVFVLSGAEDLVPVLGAGGLRHTDFATAPGWAIDRYRPRVEGLFARIERWTRVGVPGDVHWRSITSANVLSVYGIDAASRIADPADPQRIFAWLICESRDDRGNGIAYGYRKEDGRGLDPLAPQERNRGPLADPARGANRYLKRVRYGNRQPLLVDGERPAMFPAIDADWMFELVFDYGDHDAAAPLPRDDASESAPGVPQYPWPCRADMFSSYRAGFEVRTLRLCRRALMFHHFPGEPEVGADCVVRSTEFTFSQDLDPADAKNPVYAFLVSAVQAGWRRDGLGYVRGTLPPVEFGYSRAQVQDRVETIDARSMENLPAGLATPTVRWVDLHGEGVPGLLMEQGGAWFYKRNLSPLPQAAPGMPETVRARFAPLESVRQVPNLSLARGAQIMDLAGDGLPDLVVMDGPGAGFYEHDEAEGWQAFRPFASRPVRSTKGADVHFIDLDGDGHADLLVTEEDALVWHPSLGEAGFGPPLRQAVPLDEEKGPRVVFADPRQSIHLADMSGDGLADIVRVRNGDVCYWPNLGYGRFGAKVTMDSAPWFDAPEQFDPKRLRLADIDGSGTADLIYLHQGSARLYFNQSGNGWSAPEVLRSLPPADRLAEVQALDLLGNGTACLVWSSPLAGDSREPMRYVNLVGARKPHLLVRMDDNLGAETRIDYAPSTRFYVEDRLNGTPWATRLAFPVHVVHRVEVLDHVSRNRFVTRYAYHHGCYDGEEREFRGFGMVEQWDTEEFAVLAGGAFPAANQDAASHLPPVHTRTWFHTGMDAGDAVLSGDYFREPGLSQAQARELLLPGTVLPDGLDVDEAREASRALRGSMLRQEVYAADAPANATPQQVRRSLTPYLVSEQAYAVRLVQLRGPNRHAVFLAHPAESITFHYERDAADPRIEHALVLEVDAWGHTLKEANAAYGRRTQVRREDGMGQLQLVANPALAALLPADRARQLTTLVTYAEHRVTGAVDTLLAHRTPLACETVSYELTGYTPSGPAGRFRPADLVEPDPGAPGQLRHRFDGPEVAYEATASGTRRRRPIEQVRTLYRGDDMAGLLPLGQLQARALPGESYKLAFTPGLLAQVYRRASPGDPPEDLLPTAAALLGGTGGSDGGYVSTDTLKAAGLFPAADAGGHWWIPSGRAFFSASPGDAPAAELVQARQHFFQPRRYRDVFGQDTVTTFDAADLLIAGTRDALGNTSAAANDYRVLLPALLTDPNGNRSALAFDALGQVSGIAVMGKAAPATAQGDSLAGFAADLAPVQAAAFFDAADPVAAAAPLLADATTRFVHDVHRFRRTRAAHPAEPAKWEPACTAALTRETHAGAPLPPQGLRIHVAISHSDGLGREVQKKGQAEPGPVVAGGPVVAPRWVASGWTVFDNKGHAVRKYEPFFSATHAFEFGVAVGVSPVLFYDPLGRVVATLQPNHVYEKVVFDAWKETRWDANDACAPLNAQTGDPRTDPDIAGYVAAYFAAQPPGWTTWYARRSGGALGARETAAAAKAAAHADTPSTHHVDVLGRAFLTVEANRVMCAGHDLDGTEETLASRVELDIEGNARALRDAVVQGGDALGRVVVRHDHDMTGRGIRETGMEAGARWVLPDATGKTIRAWDDRGHTFTTRYDALRRPVAQVVRGDTAVSDPRTFQKDVLTETTEYGESLAAPEACNLRTRVFRQRDGAGIAVHARLDAGGNPVEAYDFKGNQLRTTRRLASDYAGLPDWAAAPALEAETFEGSARYDALNRAIQTVAPHSDAPGAKFDVFQPFYNAANLLERMDVWLQRAAEPGALIDPAAQAPSAAGVSNIDHDAKGQRTRIDYRNGASTFYAHDPETFRLARLYTRRGAAFTGDCDNPAPPPATIAAPEPPIPDVPCGLQNLRYTYDAAGNMVHVHDAAQQAIYFRNKRIDPDNDYTYDALYRLLQATGREQLAGAAPLPHASGDAGRTGLVSADLTGRFSPNDGNAMGSYTERYVYDAAGNFTRMQHRGDDPANPGWSRAYAYLETSLTEDGSAGPAKTGNRLTRTTLNPDGMAPVVEPYAHDAHGNMVRMPHLGGGAPGPNLHWDFKNRLRASELGGGGRAFYVHDAGGERVRKVWEKAPGLVEERIYLGGFELFRRHDGPIGAGTATLERQTLHVMDDRERIALVETRTLDAAGTDKAPAWMLRYQFGNHLGSASLELDEAAQIISYEEYSPYGSSTYQAVRSATETPKRYRFTGRERDDETGLLHSGARFYACWLGRWTSCDPAGTEDDLNLYCYVHGQPAGLVDPSGLGGEPPKKAAVAAAKVASPTGQNTPADVAQFEAREAAFEAGKKMQTGEVKATAGGKELPPPTGQQLDKLTGNSKAAKRLRLKYATKQGVEAGKALKANIEARSEAAAAGKKDVPHFGKASQKLVPEVAFHKGKVLSANKNPGGEPKGARTADIGIAKEPTPPSQYGALKGQKGAAVFEGAADMKLGGGKVANKPGFKAAAGVAATELTPGTPGLRVPKMGTTLNAAGGALVVVDAMKMAREKRIAEQGGTRIGPAVLEDAGGEYTITVKYGLFVNDYTKTYINGPLQGTTKDLGFFEMRDEVQKRDAKYGYFDWAGDFVPGRVAPVIIEPTGPEA